MYLVLAVAKSVVIDNDQGQMADIQVLKGDDWQCASMEERERTSEIYQIAISAMTINMPCHAMLCVL